jgi:hypothetical protein
MHPGWPSGGQGYPPWTRAALGCPSPAETPRTPGGNQTAPAWCRSVRQWGAPPGPGGRGPAGRCLRDGMPALALAHNVDDRGVDDEGFSTRGGIWIVDRRSKTVWSSSISRASWPSAKLRATREQVSISSLFGTFEVSHANLVSITPFDFIAALGRGLRFEANSRHDATVFWTYRRSTIITELTSLGWRVDEPPK